MNSLSDYQPLVSVLIPSYQKAAFLSEAVQSVLEQRDVDLELLIYDDASTDGSADIVRALHDPRIRSWLSRENRGVVHAMNFMIGQAKGAYIAFLGADDCFVADKLCRQCRHLQTNPAHAAVFTQASIMDEHGNHLHQHTSIDVSVFNEVNRTRAEWIRYLLLHGNHLCHSSALIRRDVFAEIGLFHEQYLQLHDYEFWLRLLLQHDIYVIPEKLTEYRRCVAVKEESLSGITEANRIRVLNETCQIAAGVFDRMDAGLLMCTFPETESLQGELPADGEEALRFLKLRVLSSLKMTHDCQLMAFQLLARQWLSDPGFSAWLSRSPERWKWLWETMGRIPVSYPISQCSARNIAQSTSGRVLVQIVTEKIKSYFTR